MWRDVRLCTWAFQLAVVGRRRRVLAWLYGNYQDNARAQNIPTGLDFLDQPGEVPDPR